MKTAHFPEFSWDHVPLYMHIRKNTRFDDEELAFISRCPIITFEKSTGISEYGSTEAGISCLHPTCSRRAREPGNADRFRIIFMQSNKIFARLGSHLAKRDQGFG